MLTCPKCGGKAVQPIMDIYCVTNCGKNVKSVGTRVTAEFTRHGQYMLFKSPPPPGSFKGHKFCWTYSRSPDITTIKDAIDIADNRDVFLSGDPSSGVYRTPAYDDSSILIKEFPG